ncbi:hypothetical protein BGZ96_004445 [Linnemannia gamsii]|uniref:Coth-domain-containing protein n=1 Tax=Linnemannia gamsii TaxID=64522 RepID=A0ABQ7JI61_9FUNG|nr:hypothetical protein BGZ96_004445 [Linnemannia gamsii]
MAVTSSSQEDRFPDSDAGSFGVLINGKITKLSTSPATLPLWSASVAGASTSSGYKYVKLSEQGTVVQEECFWRSFQNKNAKSTINEFFLRQVTQTTLPEIPQVFNDDVRPKPSKAFDHFQIATIHLTPDAVEFANMVATPPWQDVNAIQAGFQFISADTVYSVKKVKLKLSGRDSRYFNKLSLRIKFVNGETFFDRPIIKLRSEVFDPTMIREKLYIDILNSVGVRTTQGAWVRVYVNGKPYGFYMMVEDIELPFLRGTMHHGSSAPRDLGSLYKMSNLHTTEKEEEATMQFAGSKTANYNNEVYENKNQGDNTNDEPMAQLIDFFKDLQDYDPTLSGGIEFWNTRLDLDGFLRSMAIEYLGGAWDGYSIAGNNYFMYFNPTEARWQFIPTDFDATFSVLGKHADVLTTLTTLTTPTTYKEFSAHRLVIPGKDHPLVTKLIFLNKEISARFGQILFDIVSKVFNPKVLEPRIDAYEKMIADEVKWDYSLIRPKIPDFPDVTTLSSTIDDFHKSIIESVKGVNIGIKPWIKSRAEGVLGQIQNSGSARRVVAV